MRKFLVLFLLLALCVQINAQDSLYARHIIEKLSSPQMYGRGASYHGDSIAAEFLAQEMKRLGVLPLQVNYLQHYSYDCYSLEGDISLKINGKELEPYSQFRLFSTSRYGKTEKMKGWKRQQKDGTWIFAIDKLDTYSPIVGGFRTDPVCVEVLDSILPKKIKKVELNIPIQYKPNYRSQNVVGFIPGVIDSMIVFSAHYDHCGTMGDAIYFPGAHDNASGTAAVLDLARISSLSKPYYTMVFMLFSGEESGLKGSQYAAENPLIDYSKVKLFCNIDLFCGGDDGIMVFNAKSDNTKEYYHKLCEINNETHVAKEIRPRDNSANSDHYWFSKYCPSIYILSMGQPYGGYHDPADRCESCGLAHYHDYLSLIKQLVGLQ